MENTYTPERKDYITKEGQVFVILPFKQMLTYEKIIKLIGKELKLNCILGGSIFEEGVLLNDIIKGISESEFIIADLTDKNPNVFYELGIAHQLRKKVIIITQNENDIPADLKGHKWILYNTNTEEGIINLENKIKNSFEKLFLPSVILKNEKTHLISSSKSNESYVESDFIESDEGTFIIWAHLCTLSELKINYNKFGRAWKYLFSHSGNSGDLLEIKSQNEEGDEIPFRIHPNRLSIVKRYTKIKGKKIDTKWRFAFNNGQCADQIIECGNDSTTEPGWHLLAYTWSRANNYVKLYIDNKCIGSKDMTFWPTKSETKIVIGTWINRSPSHYYDDIVGPWKLWNKALTYEDIEKEYEFKPNLS